MLIGRLRFMLKVNVGSSISSCAKTAGKEAASKAKIGLDSIKMEMCIRDRPCITKTTKLACTKSCCSS